MAVKSQGKIEFKYPDLKKWGISGGIFTLDSDTCVVGWGAMLWQKDPSAGPCFFAPDFYLSTDTPWLVFENTAVLTKDRLANMLQSSVRGEVSDFSWEEPSPGAFQMLFNKIMGLLNSGVYEKLVPVVFAVSDQTPGIPDREEWISSCLENSELGHVYGFWNDAEGILGVSPELLFSASNKALRTVALAGTKSVSEEKSRPLLEDRKELHEHLLVVEDIQNQLADLGSVNVGQPKRIELRNLCHLRSEIDVMLRAPVDFEKLIRLLHPTPALGSFPRVQQLNVLKFLESVHERARFGAPFGVRLEDGNALSVVAIRNIQWCDGKCYLGSGCGIVKESQLEKEWAELSLKREAVRSFFGMKAESIQENLL